MTVTAQIRAHGGLSYHTGPTMAAIIREVFGTDASVVSQGPVPGELPVVVGERGADRIVVGSVVSTETRRAE